MVMNMHILIERLESTSVYFNFCIQVSTVFLFSQGLDQWPICCRLQAVLDIPETSEHHVHPPCKQLPIEAKSALTDI